MVACHYHWEFILRMSEKKSDCPSLHKSSLLFPGNQASNATEENESINTGLVGLMNFVYNAFHVLNVC